MRHAAKATDDESGIRSGIEALPRARYLLAVSGGRDSMVLLHAFTRWRGDAVAVATFDHGTGAAAVRAARLAGREAARRGVPAVTGRSASALAASEDAWRAARWAFLAGSARELSATVVTAHTRDDQVETIVMRALRDARHTSARGLAGMYAASPVARPLLDRSRASLAAYARAHRVRFLEDPTNASRAYLRNRVRLDLLPALERAHPGFAEAMLRLARQAATWREEVECVIDALGITLLPTPALVVPAAALSALSGEGLAVVWPALAARAGLTLDWRGTERLVAFTARAAPGLRVPLAGGAEVHRTPTTFVLKAPRFPEPLYS